jgi:hypothetical protein
LLTTSACKRVLLAASRWNFGFYIYREGPDATADDGSDQGEPIMSRPPLISRRLLLASFWLAGTSSVRAQVRRGSDQGIGDRSDRSRASSRYARRMVRLPRAASTWSAK